MNTATNNACEPGIRKAAILVASLDEPAADLLLEQLGPDRAELVRQAVMTLDEIDDREQQRVIDEFRRISPMLPSQCPPGIELDGLVAQQFASGGVRFLAQSDTEPAAADQDGPQPFDFLQDAGEEKLSQLLCNERPQTIALVLSHLAADRAGNVLVRFVPTLQAEVVRRLVELEKTDPEVLREVERTLEARFSQQFAIRPGRESGPEAVSRILAACDDRVVGNILDNLAAYDGPLAEQLGCRALQFDDLIEFDDARLLAVFQSAPPEVAQAALLGANPEILERLLGCMPADEAQTLRDKLDHPGPFCLSDIEEGRQQMAALAQRLSYHKPRRAARAA